MFLLVSDKGTVVRINRIENTESAKVVHLGFDIDGLIACFPTMDEALAAHIEGETDNYQYKHSLAVGVARLVIRNAVIK